MRPAADFGSTLSEADAETDVRPRCNCDATQA
jgi:hypothetical protein